MIVPLAPSVVCSRTLFPYSFYVWPLEHDLPVVDVAHDPQNIRNEGQEHMWY